MRTCNNGYKVMVEMRKDELVFDIKNTAYIYADSNVRADTDLHTLHNVFDIGEDGNRDKLARILDAAVEDCREVIFRYTKRNMSYGGFDSNEWEECIGSPTNDEEAYYLSMTMPRDFSSTSIHTLAVYIHDYIVNQSLYEWMLLAYPNGAENFKVLAEEKKQKIKEASNHSAGHLRIRLHPF